MRKIREIDVLWFDEDTEGLFPAYAFEVEHTTGIKDGLDRLLKIPSRIPTKLYIVAPSNEKEHLFNRLVNETPFRSHRDRFQFRTYDQLKAIYNATISHHKEKGIFGVEERNSMFR